jgi:hypothetical protein
MAIVWLEPYGCGWQGPSGKHLFGFAFYPNYGFFVLDFYPRKFVETIAERKVVSLACPLLCQLDVGYRFVSPLVDLNGISN